MGSSDLGVVARDNPLYKIFCPQARLGILSHSIEGRILDWRVSTSLFPPNCLSARICIGVKNSLDGQGREVSSKLIRIKPRIDIALKINYNSISSSSKPL
jgi:hypothetical protein